MGFNCTLIWRFSSDVVSLNVMSNRFIHVFFSRMLTYQTKPKTSNYKTDHQADFKWFCSLQLLHFLQTIKSTCYWKFCRKHQSTMNVSATFFKPFWLNSRLQWSRLCCVCKFVNWRGLNKRRWVLKRFGVVKDPKENHHHL